MVLCFQSAGQNMLEHGEAVRARFDELVIVLAAGGVPAGWRMPSWLTPDTAHQLLARLPDAQTLAHYQRYHDCAKHLCRVVGEDGRQQFPGHAQHSAGAWRAHGGGEAVAQLIAQDMDVHCMTADAVPEFATRSTAAALLLTALAELHANAELFGGLESASFKSKLKHLDRRGRAVLREWARA